VRERLAVRPQWRAATEALAPFSGVFTEPDTLVARTGYTGEDGFEIVMPAAGAASLWRDLAGQGVRPCGLGARDTLRLEAGLNLYGNEMDEGVLPAESGLSWTVSLKDPDRAFIGRSAVQLAKPQRWLVGLKLVGRGVMRAHMKVRTSQGDGEVTSGSISPTMGVSIALARVPKGAVQGEQAQVEIRGQWMAAEVVRPPFVRHGEAALAPNE
jgi:aminomethyltransferase